MPGNERATDCAICLERLDHGGLNTCTGHLAHIGNVAALMQQGGLGAVANSIVYHCFHDACIQVALAIRAQCPTCRLDLAYHHWQQNIALG